MSDGSRRTATQKLRRMPEELTVGRRWLALRPALLLELHVVSSGFSRCVGVRALYLVPACLCFRLHNPPSIVGIHRQVSASLEIWASDGSSSDGPKGDNNDGVEAPSLWMPPPGPRSYTNVSSTNKCRYHQSPITNHKRTTKQINKTNQPTNQPITNQSLTTQHHLLVASLRSKAYGVFWEGTTSREQGASNHVALMMNQPTNQPINHVALGLGLTNKQTNKERSEPERLPQGGPLF